MPYALRASTNRIDGTCLQFTHSVRFLLVYLKQPSTNFISLFTWPFCRTQTHQKHFEQVREWWADDGDSDGATTLRFFAANAVCIYKIYMYTSFKYCQNTQNGNENEKSSRNWSEKWRMGRSLCVCVWVACTMGVELKDTLRNDNAILLHAAVRNMFVHIKVLACVLCQSFLSYSSSLSFSWKMNMQNNPRNVWREYSRSWKLCVYIYMHICTSMRRWTQRTTTTTSEWVSKWMSKQTNKTKRNGPKPTMSNLRNEKHQNTANITYTEIDLERVSEWVSTHKIRIKEKEAVGKMVICYVFARSRLRSLYLSMRVACLLASLVLSLCMCSSRVCAVYVSTCILYIYMYMCIPSIYCVCAMCVLCACFYICI